jgi:hypothetical protein
MAVRRIAMDLTYAAAQARQTSKPVVATFNVSAGTYSFSGVEGLAQRSAPYLVNLKAEPYRVSVGTVNFGGAQQVTDTGDTRYLGGQYGAIWQSCGGQSAG